MKENTKPACDDHLDDIVRDEVATTAKVWGDDAGLWLLGAAGASHSPSFEEVKRWRDDRRLFEIQFETKRRLT